MKINNEQELLNAVSKRDCMIEAMLEVIKKKFPNEFYIQLQKANIKRATFKKIK